MKILNTPLSGVYIIETAPFIDQRGSFARAFCARELAPVLGNRAIAQINHSKITLAGNIRGLHFQYPPHAEMKFVKCIRGRIWDVALDLRAGSSTFLKWYAHELTEHNQTMLCTPEGCAHGVQALDSHSEFIYFNTQFYAPEFESGIRYNDPACAIAWPLPAIGLSDKDSSFPLLGQDFSGLALPENKIS